MNDEEKILYKFIENKILLKEFCEEYVRIKNNEELLKQESNKIKLKNCELENEIEKYRDIMNNIEKNKNKEIENNNLEYDIKIKKFEKQIDFLNSCLNAEKESYNMKVKELICLKVENDKYKLQLNNKKENNVYDKENKINHNNVNVLNKIYTDINQKVDNMNKILNDTKNSRQCVELKLKDYEMLLNEYLKKITDLNLKYEKFYLLYKEAQFKNSVNKTKKKVLKHQIEELKNLNHILSNQVIALKNDINNIDGEKKQYYLLFRKAEKKNLLFYQKLKKKKIKTASSRSFSYDLCRLNYFSSNQLDEDDIDPIVYNSNNGNNSNESNSNNGNNSNESNSNNCNNNNNNNNLPYTKNLRDFKITEKGEKTSSIYISKGVNKGILYRAEEFNIKKERKRKKILFYSDNDYDKRKKKRKKKIQF
ncbi:conserved Plasmodium protein, unknown function [Plasmodium malariae]|uniref:Uncharacterized protein n=1 Tax=Plasmodium malariae TaxID=5858 RepID=A0A1A8WWW3_PLAMA|nr:conserved Plasmodium protein, unknown function [Plasmodium malariae]